ncbi:MAG: glycosyltransferase XagB, partial [Thermomicrobiales bacterium]|nr:glycosyltransferase XagB [Thermomicrobiales bacterium]
RFAPLDAAGRPDPAGVRQFVVGTGGRDHRGFAAVRPGSEVRNDDTFGALRLGLHDGWYDWEFLPVGTGIFTDEGSGTCHGAPTSSDGEPATPSPEVIATPLPTATPVPTETAVPTPAADTQSLLFADDFESGTLALWEEVNGLGIEPAGDGQILAASGDMAAAYARARLAAPSSRLALHVRFLIRHGAATDFGLLRMLTADGAPIAAVGVNAEGRLEIRTGPVGTITTSQTPITTGIWHDLRVHLQSEIASGTISVQYDGVPIRSLNVNESVGPASVTFLELGDATDQAAIAVAYDDVFVTGAKDSPSSPPWVAIASPSVAPPQTEDPAATRISVDTGASSRAISVPHDRVPIVNLTSSRSLRRVAHGVRKRPESRAGPEIPLPFNRFAAIGWKSTLATPSAPATPTTPPEAPVSPVGTPLASDEEPRAAAGSPIASPVDEPAGSPVAAPASTVVTEATASPGATGSQVGGTERQPPSSARGAISRIVAPIVLLISLLLAAQGFFSLGLMLFTWGRSDRLREAGSPSSFEPPSLRFTAILPARHEREVIAHTVHRVWNANYPKELLEVVVVCEVGDIETIGEAQRAADEIGSPRVRVITFDDGPINKPHGLNVAFRHTSHEVVTIFDAEDDIHRDVFQIVNTIMLRKDAGIVQAGVQLMDFQSTWFAVHNVLEYFFWFKSRLHFHARIGMVPLGGNTVFMRRRLIERVGGWDEQCLTEDGDIGIRLSTLGEKITITYDAEHATREETPPTLGQFIKQRTRWNQGFIQVYRKGDWRRFPRRAQRLLAAYTLTYPFIQAFVGLLWVPALAMMVALKLNVAVAMLSLLPLYALAFQFVSGAVGLWEFTRAYHLRLRLRDVVVFSLGFLPYQLLLSIGAVRAVYREWRGRTNWEKTAHTGAHRTRVSPPEATKSSLPALEGD